MAIYTELTHEDLQQLLVSWDLPPLISAEAVPEGSINTNYRLSLAGRRVFLRHTTVRSGDELAFEGRLLQALEAARVAGPRLLPTRAGLPFVEFKGGRVVLFDLLPGRELRRDEVTPTHARALGCKLASVHQALRPIERSRPNPYGVETVRGWLVRLAAHSSEMAVLGTELEAALGRALALDASALPAGVIHADLFLDNVRWVDDESPICFDYEMACTEAWALDVAITLNAWCFDGSYQWPLARAFIEGHSQLRPLTHEERAHLYAKLLFGAVRYTASRLLDFHLSPLGADKLQKKDYRTYLARVRALQQLGPQGVASALSA